MIPYTTAGLNWQSFHGASTTWVTRLNGLKGEVMRLSDQSWLWCVLHEKDETKRRPAAAIAFGGDGEGLTLEQAQHKAAEHILPNSTKLILALEAEHEQPQGDR